MQILLLFFVFYYYWEWSIQLSKYFGLNHENEIIVSAICIFIKVIISDIIDLPLNIYDTFVLEEKHGFNKQVSDYSFLRFLMFHLSNTHLYIILFIIETIILYKRSTFKIDCIRSNCGTSYVWSDMDCKEWR